MNEMRWNSDTGNLEPKDGRKFVSRILLAHVRGITAEQFADEELARMAAERGEPVGADPPQDEEE